MKMKKMILWAVTVIAVLALNGCHNPLSKFDSQLIVGKWQRSSTITDGLDCYRYDANGTGVTWDTGDDVTEAEAQPFTWKITDDELVLIHEGEMGARVPKTYTLKQLTSTTLSYTDSYNVSYTFVKVN